MLNKIVADCSSFSAYGLSLGYYDGSEGRARWSDTSVSIYNRVGKGSVTTEFNGQTIPVYLLELQEDGSQSCTHSDSGYKPIAYYPEKGYLLPGDIINMRPNHVVTVLAVNRTGKEIVIPQNLTGWTDQLKIGPNQIISISTGTYDKPHRLSLDSKWFSNVNIKVLRPSYSFTAKECP